MGRRNDDKLTARQEDTADQTMRTLLAHRNEPTTLMPPPTLAARIAEQLPPVPPAAAAVSERRRVLRRTTVAWAGIVLLLLLGSMGAWGVLVDSNAPAFVFGGPDTTFGYAALFVTLAAKPIIALLFMNLPLLLVGTILAIAIGWLWWRLMALPSGPVAMEQRS